MKCPICDNLVHPLVGYIDPAELLDLIEKAIERLNPCFVVIEMVRQYLSGDQEPLKKLAGEK